MDIHQWIMMSRSQQTAENSERVQLSALHDRNDGSFPSLSQASYYSQDISDQIRDMDIPADLPWPAPSSNSLQKRRLDNLHDCVEALRPSKQAKFRKPSAPSLESQQINMRQTSSGISERSHQVIAYSEQWQPYLDKNTSFGVQYEIARLVSSGYVEYRDLSTENHLCQLGGSKNAEAAPKTVEVLLGKMKKSIPPTRERVWKELDDEIEALAKDELAALGFSQHSPEWHGGKVEFRARLEQRDLRYQIVLERAELGPSCRFTRRFGSMSFLRVKVPEELLNKPHNGLVEYFSHPFILCGRVFRSFYAKDDHVFLFWTNETLNDTQSSPTRHPKGMSLLEFLEWHNPLRDNANQTMAKWAARFGLGLSSTIPGIRLQPDEIGFEHDIVSPTNSDMTDGCGFISRSGLLQLYTRLKWKLLPSAIQCRLGGAKGLLALRSEAPAGADQKVWLRPSQIKIRYPESRVPDPAALIIDIFSLTRMKTPGHLTSETLINLTENGVPSDIFVTLLKDGLDAHVAGLIEWEGPDAALGLWCVLARKVKYMSRKARQVSSEARVRGYEGSETGLPEEADEEDTVLQQPDEAGALPSSPEELVMNLLDAGFTPKNCSFLLQKLKGIVTSSIHSYVQEYSIDVPMSCTALLIPDPFGVLAPNEVQIRCREKRLKTDGGDEVDIILGDVLLTRYPCKLPTDFQKFVAVEKPELYDYMDVIVCSVQGHRRMADLLAGGDYDGDLGQVIWQSEILDCFIPADLKHADEPPEVAQCFSKVNETVADFQKRMMSQPDNAMIPGMLQFLLGNIRDSSVVGMYSTFHDNATYHFGLDHRETIRLANMFAKVLDGSKTGLKVLPEIFRRDKQKWQHRRPYWKKTAAEKEQLSKEAEEELCSRGGRQPFIMDVISKQSVRIGADKLREIEEYFRHPIKNIADPHLTRPWLDAEKIATRYWEEERCDRKLRDLRQIKDVVKRCYDKLQQSASLESVRKEFAENPSPTQLMMDKYVIDRLKASFAYLYDLEQEKRTRLSSFPWDMAMPMLCTIKAEAIGSSKTITMKFYERFRIKQYPTRNHTTGF